VEKESVVLKTVLIPPILAWNMLKQLPQQIASQFAKNGYKVYFCENPDNGYSITEVEPNLFVYGNAKLFLKEFREKNIKIDILYTTWAKTFDWVDLVDPKVTIYHSCDSFEDWKIYEKDMMNYSDIVCCTSEYIYNMRKSNHKNVHLIRNGCNESFIDAEWTLPDEIKFLKPPLFTFAGACANWVNTFVLKKIAEDYVTIFLGSPFGKEIPTNLFNLGVKQHDDLIHYYNASDICLLPFNPKLEVTQAACPIKLYEYLSCGKPVLSTSWEETELEELKDVVFTAKSNSDYIELAHELAKLTLEEKQFIDIKARAIARNNTWEKKFEQMEMLINNL